jgi:hypothetical protein
MAEEWITKSVRDVEPGATVRLGDGRELLVSRVEPNFFGMAEMTALIEDSPRQWFKAPMATDGEIEVRVDPG